MRLSGLHYQFVLSDAFVAFLPQQKLFVVYIDNVLPRHQLLDECNSRILVICTIHIPLDLLHKMLLDVRLQAVYSRTPARSAYEGGTSFSGNNGTKCIS